MKRLLAGVLVGALAIGSGVAIAAEQDGKSARGTVTAVGPDSVTVKVKDHDMKFGVDAKTRVMTRGGTTATKAAKAEGKSGPMITSVVKEGEMVEVHYSEAGMHASTINVLPGSPAAVPSEKKSTAGAQSSEKKPSGDAKPSSSTTAGVVTALTGSSLTLKTSAGESTFTIDDKTHFIGTGLGTQSRESAAAGKKQVLADVVGVGDSVSVTWQDMAGAKHASSVRVRTKAAKK